MQIPVGDLNLAGQIILPKFALDENGQPIEKLPLIIINPGLDAPMKYPQFKSWGTGLALGGPYAILLYDIRGQGKSPGKRVIGETIFNDATKVIDFAENLPEIDPQRIGFWGISLGGQMALTRAFIDNRIKAIVALCALNNLKQNFTVTPKSLFRKIVRIYLRLSGVNGKKISDENNRQISPAFYLDQRPELKDRTMLLICKNDEIIDYSEFEINQKTLNSPADHLGIFKKGGHTFHNQELSVLAHSLRFFKRYL